MLNVNADVFVEFINFMPTKKKENSPEKYSKTIFYPKFIIFLISILPEKLTRINYQFGCFCCKQRTENTEQHFSIFHQKRGPLLVLTQIFFELTQPFYLNRSFQRAADSMYIGYGSTSPPFKLKFISGRNSSLQMPE